MGPDNLAYHYLKLEFLPSVTQRVFVECLLCARHYAGGQQQTKQTEQALVEITISLGRQTINRELLN